jgi:hypothetical protein
MADNIPRCNERAGPFGSKDTRFKETRLPEPRSLSPTGHSLTGDGRDAPARPVSPTRQARPVQISTYASRNDGRVFRELERNVLYPPPGAYETTPSWENIPGVLPMIPHKHGSVNRAKVSIPGPGDYNLADGIGSMKLRNRKNIMLTTASRDVRPQSDAPGPGMYAVFRVFHC